MAKKKTAKKTTKKVTQVKKKAVAKKGTKKNPVKTKAHTITKASQSKNTEVSIDVPKAPKKNKSNGKKGILAILAIFIIIAAIFAITAYQPAGDEKETGVAQANALDIIVTSTETGVEISTNPTGETFSIPEGDIAYLTELFKTNGYEPTQSEIIQEAVVRQILLNNAKGLQIDSTIIDELKNNQVFTQRIENTGYTVEEFISLYKPQLEKDLLIQEYFNQKIATKIPSQKAYEASHILVCYEGAQSCTENRTEEEARNIATAILSDVRKINTEEYFATKAQGSSDGPSSVNGGYLGPVTPGVMIPAFEEATFALEQGEISDLVQTDFGFHIIRVSGISETPDQQALVVALTDLREKIVQNAGATEMRE